MWLGKVSAEVTTEERLSGVAPASLSVGGWDGGEGRESCSPAERADSREGSDLEVGVCLVYPGTARRLLGLEQSQWGGE